MSPVAAEVDRSALIDGFVTVLLAKGPSEIPEKFRQPTIDEAWRRLCDPEMGFAWFWLHLAWIHVKGRGKGTGWQRACPDSKPRQNANGRDWAWQLEVARVIVLYTLMLILKARQIGFTYLVANLVIWAAISDNEQIIAVIANKMQSSKRLVRRSVQVYNRLPDWVKARVRITNPAISRLEFSNGSVVEPYSGDPDAARSDAATWVFADEIGEIDKLNDWFASTESVADSGGRLVMFGTAKDNGMEDWCIEADSGEQVEECVIPAEEGKVIRLPVMQSDSDMAFLFVPDYVHPERTDEWRARKVKVYKGNLRNFDREHPLTWRDAFIAQGKGYFDPLKLKEQYLKQMALYEARDRRGTLLPSGNGYKFVEDPYGHIVIHATEEEFAEVLAARRPWVMFADVAGSSPSGDYHATSAVNVGRVPSFEQMALEGHRAVAGVSKFEGEIIPHKQLITIHGYMDQDHYAELLMRVGYFLGTALIAVEVNGVGTGIIGFLRKARYPNLYIRTVKATKFGQKARREYGWYTTSESKHEAYGEGERLLRNDFIEVRDVETINEMTNVLHLGGQKIGAREPKHDDRSDGLTGACAMISSARAFAGGEYVSTAVNRGPEFGTLEWLTARIDARHNERTRRGAIGSENRDILAG